eukprot:61568_1
MHGIINNGITLQKYIIIEHICSIHKLITWLQKCTRSFSLFTSLYAIFVTSNVILAACKHCSTHLIRGNGQKWIFLSIFAVVGSSAHQVREQVQKEYLWM